MERETGLMSWFSRTVPLNPILRSTGDIRSEMSTIYHDDSDDDQVDEVEGGDVTGMSYKKYQKWCHLREDNVRFWDCFGMLRSDPTLSSQTAIQRIAETPNSDYFSHELSSGLSYYFSTELELDIELLRLMVENPRLHAVMWVLSDNPNLQLDAVLGAIFRLNQEEFQEKFLFEYEPGCFSSKKTILHWNYRKFGLKGSKKELYYKKRCRSSTPIRSTRLRRFSSDMTGHLVSKKSRVPRGQNISGNRKCATYIEEPSRKRPYFLLMPTLMTDTPRRWSCKDVGLYSPMDNGHNDEDEEDVDNHSCTTNNNASSGIDPHGSNNTKNNHSTEDFTAGSTLEQGTAHDIIIRRTPSSKVTNILQSTNKHQPCSLHLSPKQVSPNHEMRRSRYQSSIYYRHPDADVPQGLEPDRSSCTTVQFIGIDNSPAAPQTPQISLSEKPRPSVASFTPYPVSLYTTPSVFIARHTRLAEKMLNTQRKCDLQFCLKRRKDVLKRFNFRNTRSGKRFRESSLTKCDCDNIKAPVICDLNAKMEEKRCRDKDSEMSVSTNTGPVVGILKGCKSRDICKQQKEAILELGRRQFTKPLMVIVNRGVLCSKYQL